jgi:Zn-dependent protease
MFAFFGVYWSIYGWPLALGLVVAIYIHEMGHVMMLRRLGIDASAPLFIPGVGALVMLKQRVVDPLTDAKIGLAGPVWGLGAALTAAVVYAVTRAPVWLAIAQLTAFLNLFNLTPVWQLDGSRGIHALARGERWILVATIAIALMITEQRLLLVVGGVAVWRAVQQDAGPGDSRVLATFVVLVAALSWLARSVG